MSKVYKYTNSAGNNKYVLYDTTDKKINKLNNPNNAQKIIGNQSNLGLLKNEMNSSIIRAINAAAANPAVNAANPAVNAVNAAAVVPAVNAANPAVNANANANAKPPAVVSAINANPPATNFGTQTNANPSTTNIGIQTNGAANSVKVTANPAATTGKNAGTIVDVTTQNGAYTVTVMKKMSNKATSGGKHRTHKKKHSASRKQKRSTRMKRKQNKRK